MATKQDGIIINSEESNAYNREGEREAVELSDNIEI